MWQVKAGIKDHKSNAGGRVPAVLGRGCSLKVQTIETRLRLLGLLSDVVLYHP